MMRLRMFQRLTNLNMRKSTRKNILKKMQKQNHHSRMIRIIFIFPRWQNRLTTKSQRKKARLLLLFLSFWHLLLQSQWVYISTFSMATSRMKPQLQQKHRQQKLFPKPHFLDLKIRSQAKQDMTKALLHNDLLPLLLKTSIQLHP